MKEGVDKLAPSALHHAYTCDIISNAPSTRRDVLVCTLLHREL